MTALPASRVRPPVRSGRAAVPTLREERRLLRDGYGLVGGVDEVGRGALAGPVTVGVVVVGPSTRTAPSGLRDSKLLTAAAREALAPALRRWAPAWAVGHAEPHEIDAVGIIAALRLAGRRAIAQLQLLPEVVLLDGSHDWLTEPYRPEGLFEVDEVLLGGGPVVVDTPVRTMVKADLRCAAVAAASVLAKTTRDAIMVQRALQHPAYGWGENKGYSAPEHLDALTRVGPCAQHRLSWRLPGCESDDEAVPRPGPDDVPLLEDVCGPGRTAVGERHDGSASTTVEPMVEPTGEPMREQT